MTESVLIAAVLGAVQTAFAIAVFRFAAKAEQRSLRVRLAAAFTGALAAGLVARPLVNAVVLLQGKLAEEAFTASLLTFACFLPVTLGVSGWLFAEVLGGRSEKPWRALVYGLAGGLFGCALVFGLLLGAKPQLPPFVGFTLLFGVPSATTTAGLAFSKMRFTSTPARDS